MRTNEKKEKNKIKVSRERKKFPRGVIRLKNCLEEGKRLMEEGKKQRKEKKKKQGSERLLGWVFQRSEHTTIETLALTPLQI